MLPSLLGIHQASPSLTCFPLVAISSLGNIIKEWRASTPASCSYQTPNILIRRAKYHWVARFSNKEIAMTVVFVVWEGNSANGQSATANWLHNMSRTLPPMMQVMRDIGSVDIPETLATLVNGEGHPITKERPAGTATAKASK